MYNKNATQELNRLEAAFNEVKGELFDRLHTLIRDDIFEDASTGKNSKKGGGGDAAGGGDDAGGGGRGVTDRPQDRSYKDRLEDQVNSTGSLGGSTDEDRKGAPSSR
jgi:arogenate dehydrogenase (NADP+)